MNYKAVIFDLDGTLLDTLEDIADSMNNVLRRHKFGVHEIQSYNFFVGDGMKNLVIRALPETERRPELVDKLTIEMENEYDKNWANKTTPYKGVIETLLKLSELGVKINVLSNKPHKFTVAMVKKYFSSIKFNHVIGASDKFIKKPDPAAAIYISQELNIDASGFIYAGDTNTDINTAHNAKMFAVGVSWGFRPAAELKTAGADIIIDRPEQILNLFAS